MAVGGAGRETSRWQPGDCRPRAGTTPARPVALGWGVPQPLCTSGPSPIRKKNMLANSHVPYKLIPKVRGKGTSSVTGASSWCWRERRTERTLNTQTCRSHPNPSASRFLFETLSAGFLMLSAGSACLCPSPRLFPAHGKPWPLHTKPLLQEA